MLSTRRLLHLSACALLALAPFAASAMQVFARLPSNVLITLDVEPSDVIENVKAKVEDKTGTPATQQVLSFSGTTLQDGYTLSDYNIQKEAILVMTIQQATPTNPATTYGFRRLVKGLRVQ